MRGRTSDALGPGAGGGALGLGPGAGGVALGLGPPGGVALGPGPGGLTAGSRGGSKSAHCEHSKRPVFLKVHSGRTNFMQLEYSEKEITHFELAGVPASP